MFSFIQYLIEKRSNPDKNVKQQAINQLFKYSNNAENLYASYTAIHKLGINPQSAKKYNTPIGIYTYHLPYMISRMNYTHRIDDVPYMGDQPNLWIVQPTTQVLVLQQYTKHDLERDKQKLIRALGNKFKNINDDMETYAKQANYKIPPGIMWNITRELAGKNPHKWNYILRVILGYNVIRDDGGSIIHGNEPYQCVFLSIKSFKVVEKINKTDSGDSPETTQLKRQRNELLVSMVTNIKQSCMLFMRSKDRKDFDKFITELEKAADEFVKFKLEVALGEKLFRKFKDTIMNLTDPYYLLNISSIISIKEFDDKVNNNPELILQMVKLVKNNYTEGEKTIAKSQEYSIKYVNLLSNILQRDVIFDLSYKSSEEWKQIVKNVLTDQNEFNKIMKKHSTSVIYSRFEHLGIPNFEKFKPENEKDAEEELFKAFHNEGDYDSLKELCEYYGRNKEISDNNWAKLIKQIDDYLYDNTSLFKGLIELLRIFPNEPIQSKSVTSFLLHCISYYHHKFKHGNIKNLFDELCFRGVISHDFVRIISNTLSSIEDPDELKSAIHLFDNFMKTSYNGDEDDEISSIIDKYENKIAELNIASGSF